MWERGRSSFAGFKYLNRRDKKHYLYAELKKKCIWDLKYSNRRTISQPIMLRILVNLLHDFSLEKNKCKDLINSPTTPLFPFILFTDLSCCEILILSLHTIFIQLSTFIFLKNTAEERFSKQFSAMLNNLWVTLLLARIPFDSLFSSMWLSIPLAYPLHRCLIVTAFWAPQLHRLPEKKKFGE